jgi:hypothetical protein
MRLCLPALLLLALPLAAHSEDNASRVRKAIERSTLDQPGTKPFHLKATLAPSRPSDDSSDRIGTIEIWWASPTQWKRDLAIPGFHLVEITDGTGHWQHTDGDYFPEWLREIALSLIQPVPNRDQVLSRIKTAEVRTILGSTYFSWMEFSSNGETSKAMGAGLTLTDNSGLLAFGSGIGWSFHNSGYSSFHNLLVARTVSDGNAKITTLEDLGSVPSGLFDTTQPGGDFNPLRALVVDEPALRKNLQAAPPPTWPALKDGPLEGAATTTIVVDREGRVRDVGIIVTDNPGMSLAMHDYIAAMRFQPYLRNGQPVQVLSRITLSFKTTRPAGVETYDSARNYFEHGRALTSPAALASPTPYILHATFKAGTKDGIQQGQYTDTFLSASQWCREATIAKSRFVRCRDNDKTYLVSNGSDVPLLQLVLKAIEPIPAIDTFVESDWRISRHTIDGASLIRVATGHESADGTLDAQSRGLWFNSNGILIRSHFHGLDTVRSQFQDFHGAQIPYQIDVLSDGKLGMRILVASIETDTNLSSQSFILSGHDWKRQFTDETR